MIEFVTTPTGDWLRGAIAECSQRLLVSSPYIGSWLPALNVGTTARRLVLTRADLRDFASGASDLESVCALAEGGFEVFSSHRLHAKVYVVDESFALVTSANATFSGMRRNLECGVVLRDTDSVKAAASLILSAFGTTKAPQRWKLADLEALREPVRALRKALSPALISEDVEQRALPDVSPDSPIGDSLRNHLPGWTKLALEGVQMQAADVFDIASFVATCSPLAAARFPNNRHVREKLRQQLQRLRDLGLLEFLGEGRYRRQSAE